MKGGVGFKVNSLASRVCNKEIPSKTKWGALSFSKFGIESPNLLMLLLGCALVVEDINK